MSGLYLGTAYSHTLTDLDVDFHTDTRYKSLLFGTTDPGLREVSRIVNNDVPAYAS